jgi:hypothetical protein
LRVPQWAAPKKARNLRKAGVLSPQPTIAELIEILDSEEDNELEILPNGEIRALGTTRSKKPLTMREGLGGEYAA